MKNNQNRIINSIVCLSGELVFTQEFHWGTCTQRFRLWTLVSSSWWMKGKKNNGRQQSIVKYIPMHAYMKRPSSTVHIFPLYMPFWHHTSTASPTFPWSRKWGQGTGWPASAGKWWGPAYSCPGSVPAWSARSWRRSRRWWPPLPPSAPTVPCILHSTSRFKQQQRTNQLQSPSLASCSILSLLWSDDSFVWWAVCGLVISWLYSGASCMLRCWWCLQWHLKGCSLSTSFRFRSTWPCSSSLSCD